VLLGVDWRCIFSDFLFDQKLLSDQEFHHTLDVLLDGCGEGEDTLVVAFALVLAETGGFFSVV